MDIQYYFVPETGMLAKFDDELPYVYKDGQWTIDNNEFMDLFMGYDGEGIGNYDGLPDIKEITEAEALELMKQQNNQS